MLIYLFIQSQFLPLAQQIVQIEFQVEFCYSEEHESDLYSI